MRILILIFPCVLCQWWGGDYTATIYVNNTDVMEVMEWINQDFSFAETSWT